MEFQSSSLYHRFLLGSAEDGSTVAAVAPCQSQGVSSKVLSLPRWVFTAPDCEIAGLCLCPESDIMSMHFIALAEYKVLRDEQQQGSPRRTMRLTGKGDKLFTVVTRLQSLAGL